jgi:hypothetical protein
MRDCRISIVTIDWSSMHCTVADFVAPAVWDDAAADWRQFASVVIRATWDYHLRQRRYAAWLHGVRPQAIAVDPPGAPSLDARRRQAGDLGERVWYLANVARLGGGRPAAVR